MTLAAELVVLLVIAFVGLLASRALRLPAIAGYLLAGVVAGPAVFGLLAHSHEIELVAELGVALLLFGVGIEFSLADLRRSLARLATAGGAQVALTIALVALMFRAFGLAWGPSLFVGFTASLSSTAVVFKLFGETSELETPHGRAATGILLVQDLALVPMMLLVPVLASTGDDVLASTGTALAKAGLALVGLLVLGRLILPRALAVVARARVPELFPVAALIAAFGTAFLATRLGLSLPIGAFLAGLALSGNRYAHQVFAELLPLRDAFVAIFFTSVGLLVNPAAMASAPGALVLMLLAVLLKALVTGGVVHLLWKSPVTAVTAALATAQIGEFAFVLAATGSQSGLLTPSLEQGILGATILTMAVTPFLHRFGLRLGRMGAAAPTTHAASAHQGHVLLLGYGQTGRAVAQVLRKTGIPFETVDLQPDHVDQALADGVTVHFGDASRRAMLEQLGAARMRAAVVTVGDPAATRRITALLRQLAPEAPIVVRAHRVDEVDELERLGATEVVPSEFEAAIEVFSRLFVRLGVPPHVVRMQESLLRVEHYRTLRGGTAKGAGLDLTAQRRIAAGLVERAVVLPEAPIEGRSLAESQLEARHRVQVLALVRGDEPMDLADPTLRFEPDDLVVLFGPHAGVTRALAEFEPAAVNGEQ
jgi:CPA2 family monovalent cation:H+ antiporter-2